jgi:hypothetical protein
MSFCHLGGAASPHWYKRASSPVANRHFYAHGQEREAIAMALKAPGILVFTLSIILSLAVLFSRFFGATVPYLTGDTTQFYAMWAAYLVLLLGCIMRGL